MNNYLKLFDDNNNYIAYRKLNGKKISIVFFSGFKSNMNGIKATSIYRFCQDNDIELIIFDYFGHGYSTGNLIDYTISDWKKNCIEIITKLTSNKKVLIIGSSMGGWLMLLTSIEIPEKIKALIGISSAPDFTENLIFKQLSCKQKKELYYRGKINFISKNCIYEITKKLIEDGRKNLLLNKKIININSPIRLLHSIDDNDVPYQTSIKLAKKIKSKDVELYLIKSKEHNMCDKRSFEILFRIIKEFLPTLYFF